MTWLCRNESRDSAGTKLVTVQAVITDLNRN